MQIVQWHADAPCMNEESCSLPEILGSLLVLQDARQKGYPGAHGSIPRWCLVYHNHLWSVKQFPMNKIAHSCILRTLLLRVLSQRLPHPAESFRTTALKI